MANAPHKFSGGMIRLYGHLSVTRRAQLVGLLFLMIAGALAELATLGAIVPFLALMADPSKITRYLFLKQLFGTWGGPNGPVFLAAILFGFIALAAAAVRVLLTWVGTKVSFGVAYDLGIDIYRRTLYQSYEYHVARNSSEIIAGVNKAQLVVNNLVSPLIAAMTASIVGAAILAGLLVVNPIIALSTIIGFGSLYAAIILTTRRVLLHNGKVIDSAEQARVQAIQEGLGGIRDILIDSSQEVYVRRFEQLDLALRRVQTTNTFIGNAPRFVIEALGMLMIAALACILSTKPGGLLAAMPVLGALAIGSQKLLPLTQQVFYGVASIESNSSMLDSVLALLEQPVMQEHASNVEPVILPFERNISLDDVSFRYSADGKSVLDHLNLNIEKGSRIGFIGKTGSGKSTALNLIMGLLQPSGGSILIDGVALTPANRQSWQMRLAHVPQVIYLADASIAENIAFGIEPRLIDHDRVREAARKAHIADHIEGLREQYSTMVGEHGVRLSGGQRQRIGIARALYKKADVVVFDEATSALDDGTEGLVMDAINELDADLTIIIVAHRLSTLSVCDCIFELDNGRLLKQGNYDDMTNKILSISKA